MAKPSGISAFDLDHTLININGSFKFGHFLHQKKMLSTRTMLPCVLYYILYKNKCLSIHQMQHLIFNKFFKGNSASTIADFSEEFIAQYLDKILYRPALDRLNQAKQAGHYTVLLSSSPSFLVEPIARKLNFNGWASSCYSASEGKFFEIEKIMLGEDKAQFLEALALTLAVPKGNTFAYSDSIHDLKFLLSAGNAIAVNPDRALRKVFKERNWPII